MYSRACNPYACTCLCTVLYITYELVLQYAWYTFSMHTSSYIICMNAVSTPTS